MLLGQIFDRFVKHSPITVMARVLMERALNPDQLNELFYDAKVNQKTRELLFSSLVDLMALVVCNIRPKVNLAYRDSLAEIHVSLTAVYAKLKGVEPQVCRVLVQHTAEQLAPVIDQLGGAKPELLPGYRVKILDGSHLAKTQHRLKVLRKTRSGPLPGQSLVVLDPRTMLVVDVLPCEDAHAQERALLVDILPTVAAGDLWIEDRNFCTTQFVFGVAQQTGCFLVRQHKSTLHREAVTELVDAGRIATGALQEQTIRLSEVVRKKVLQTLEVRRIRLVLDQPTRGEDAEIFLLTNLPAEAAPATVVAQLYRERWTLEEVFQSLATALQTEINTLGYPKAALFGFCVGLAAYNVLAAIRGTVRAVHGAEEEEEVSDSYLADEVQATYRGMMIAIPEDEWEFVGGLSVEEVAELLKGLAQRVDLRLFRRRVRSEKKPQPPRSSGKKVKHVSTARLLAEAKTTKVIT
jgi:Transposase DDE domain